MAGKHMRQEAPDPGVKQEPIGTVEAAPAESRRKKHKRKGGILSTLLIVVGLALLAAAGGMWGLAQYRYHMQEKVNRELSAYAVVRDETAEGEERHGPEVDWAALKEVNDEIVGWLQVPGTVINYPVYQHSDNEYYLRTSAMGEWSVGGQVFLDYECVAPGLVDNQSILYGHHLQDGTMFQPLTRLDQQEVFDATDTLWYVTEAREYELEPLLLYYTNPYDQNVRRFTFKDVSEFRTYLYELLDHAVTSREDAAQIIAGTNHVLTMSTCNYYDGYGRSILVCIPKEEAEAALNGITPETPTTETPETTDDTAETEETDPWAEEDVAEPEAEFGAEETQG